MVGVDPRRRARAASTVTRYSQVGEGGISAEGIQIAYDLKQHLLGEVLGIRGLAQHQQGHVVHSRGASVKDLFGGYQVAPGVP